MEKLYHNGTFITMDEAVRQPGAVLVRDGIIEAAGSLEELREQAPKAEQVDLCKAAVLPGFIDGHSHLTAVASAMQLANLRPSPSGSCNSAGELTRILKNFLEEKKAAGELKKDGWILGMGYDNAFFPESRHPGIQELDLVSTEYPVAAIHVSGHICAVNTRAMELLGYTGGNVSVPEGGIVEAGGLLKENAFLSPDKQKIMVSALGSDMPGAIKKASEYYASFGITTAQDARTGAGDYQNLLAAGERGLLKNDVVLYMAPEAAAEFLPKQNPKENPYISRVRAAGYKLFLDGSPQGKTAWLSKPYFQVPEGEADDYRGHPVLDDGAVTDIMEQCMRKHWQINVHANGDAAIEQMIRCQEAAGERTGTDIAALRPVMIHCQTATKGQIERMGQDGILASFFNDHVYYWGDYHYGSVLGPERAENISPLAWALKAGVSFTLHQDSPVTPPDILLSIHNAVNRRTKGGRLLGGSQRITVMEALRAVTIGGARQIFEEDRKGSITPGKLADFVVLDRSPLETSPEKIRDIRVLAAIKEGETVYCAKNDCIF